MNTASSGSGRVDDIKGHPQGEIRGQTKLVKTIPRLLLVSFPLLAMVSAHEALAGDCASGRCPFTSVAPSVPPAPATASASHGFTATGGTRVADVNLSPEGLARLAAGGKEEPLPKGFSTAADRAKLVTRQSPLYGWQENQIPRPSSRAQSHYSIATRARVVRSVARPAKSVTAVKVAIAASAPRP
jgi:hypothetical protein